MASPIVPWRLSERLLVLVPLALVLAQGFNSIPAPLGIKPHLRQHQTHRLNARLHPNVRHNGKFPDVKVGG
jgi:hypothetical protein